MTKLEPTRTSSDLTATERLRELLDERGVEWMDDSYAQLWCTVWDGQDGKQWRMTENQSGMLTELKAWKATPEQAIAATLGVTDATAARQGDASCNCSNSERTNETCLPHFWTHDGTLHVELPKLPDSISVRLPDQRDREAGSARVWQYTRGSGTCREVYLLMATDIGDGREEVLGAYTTEEAAMAAINENQFGYALHHVRKWEVDA